MGLALMANFYYNIPYILEINDLEFAVTNPSKELKQDLSAHMEKDDPNLKCPYSEIWTRIMHDFAKMCPVIATHNKNIDKLLDRNSFQIRNIKDECHYNPDLYTLESQFEKSLVLQMMTR